MTMTSTSALSDLGLTLPAAAAKDKRQTLGQEDFLRLMTTQMKYQDPFKPLDATEFLGQIAQFSTVSGVQSLNESFTALSGALTSSQALQAAQLVGHGVLVPSEQGYLESGEGLYGALDLPASGPAAVDIFDAAGQRVRTLDLGVQPAGLQHFRWDGLSDSGAELPSGSYTLRGRLSGASRNEAVDTLAVGWVNSVSLGSAGLNLNLLGMDPAAFSSVRQIF
jgi:flagellar basal-body rod modification protein FlgD